MKAIRSALLLTCSVVCMMSNVPACAQDTSARTELQRADLSGAPGMEVISSILEVKPGEEVPKHFHHGVEAAYVLRGAMLRAPGKAPVPIATGSAIIAEFKYNSEAT